MELTRRRRRMARGQHFDNGMLEIIFIVQSTLVSPEASFAPMPREWREAASTGAWKCASANPPTAHAERADENSER